MKAILEFQLPEDRADFLLAQKAGEYENIMWHWENFLRTKVKYGEEKDQATTWDDVREEWFKTRREVEGHE